MTTRRWRALTIRRRRALALALTLTAVLGGSGGCLGLPDSSPVLAGRGVNERVAVPARVVVPPPAKGASMEAVAVGFLRAGAAFQQTDEQQQPVGRSYLAPASVERWRPTSAVTVFDRDATLLAVAVGPSQVKVSTEAVALLDGDGRYRELVPRTAVEVVFDLTRMDGEWRVQLPEPGFGIWVSTDDFGLLFDAYAVNYPALTGRGLVPDVRWFTTGPRLVTALARAQLGPVPEYLSGAAGTGVPSGVGLAVDAVAVQDQIATVVLSGAANTPDDQRRRAMWAQFAATLTHVPGVSAVALEVQGTGPILVPEVTHVVSSPAQVGYDAAGPATARSGLLRIGERLARVDLTRLDSLDTDPTSPAAGAGSPELPTIPLGYVGLAMSPDGSDLAAVGVDGTELRRWRGGAQAPVSGLGDRLTRPAYGGQGRPWVGGRSPDGGPRIWWLAPDPNAGAQAVDAPWLQGRLPLSLAVSPDGTRLAVVTSAASGGDTRLDICGVARDPKGAPSSLAVGYRQAHPLTRLVDATWVDDRTLAVLGALAETDPIRAFTVELGQGVGLRRIGLSDPAFALGVPIPGARAVVTAGGNRGFAVMTSAPSVVVRAGATWRRLGAATELVVPPTR